MCIRFSALGLITFVLCVPPSPAQDLHPNSDPSKASVLILKNGDYRWVKELKHNGPMFEFYEDSGRRVELERYVSMPASMIDVDAVADVNTALIELRSACSKGEAANFEIDLEGRARRIFIDLAMSGAAYDGTSTENLGSCFFSTPMWKDIRRRTAAAATPIPSPTPTPRPTRTPSPRPGDLVCRVFEGKVTGTGERFQISLETDLPDDTVLSVTVTRTYQARGEDGVETYGIRYLSEDSTVGEWKKPHSVDVSNEIFEQALDQEVGRIQSYGIRHSVVQGGISGDIEVSFLVTTNQPNPAFGELNKNLVGHMVEKMGKMRLIRWTRPFAKPVSSTSSFVYVVFKTETYTASVAGHFEQGSKVHVVTKDWIRAEDIAKEIARRDSNRAVTVFFWNQASDVGTKSAIYGVELVNRRVVDILVDNR